MQKLLSWIMLSAVFVAVPALADNAMRLTDTQMEVVTAGTGGGTPPPTTCCDTTRVSLRDIQANLQRDYGQSIQNLKSDLSTSSNTLGGATNSR